MTNTINVLRVANRDQCIGCYSCMYACSRMLRAHGGIEKAAMRVRAYTGVEGAFSIRVCARCAEPDCAMACPNGALFTARDGGVYLKRDMCIHCRKCVLACKSFALQWDHMENIPLPCIHCGQCTRHCPNNVIVLSKRESSQNEQTWEEGAPS